MTAITVNGLERSLASTPVHTTALDFLRAQGLTGAKEGCAEGECGACSVMVARPDGDAGTRWTAINACLVPAASLDGQEVVTAEGIGAPEALHPVQREMADRGGSQCGYCTPGFICSMAAEYYRRDRTSFDHHALSGNLCRCTGYRPILAAANALGSPPAGDALAERCAHPPPGVPRTSTSDEFGTLVRPADVAEALDLLQEHPEATVLAGSTDLGVDVNLRGARPAYVVAVDRLVELREVAITAEHVDIGAALSLSEVESALAGRVPLLDELFPQFASQLIRNGATIGGNLATASPIGDLAPALLALEADVVLVSVAGERVVPLADYFTGYRETVRRSGELVRGVRLPLPLSGVTAFHKISKRRYDDISSVAVGFALDVRDGVVTKARIGLGGVAATPVRAVATEAALEGRAWSEEAVEEAAAVMRTEGTPIDDQRASAAYRSAMLGTALLRLWAAEAAS